MLSLIESDNFDQNSVIVRESWHSLDDKGPTRSRWFDPRGEGSTQETWMHAGRVDLPNTADERQECVLGNATQEDRQPKENNNNKHNYASK